MSTLGERFESHANVSTTDRSFNRKNLEAVLAAIFREDLQLDPVSPETDLFTTGILDSLKIVELMVCLETRFGLQIMQDDLEIDNFRSPAAIAAFVSDSLQKQIAAEQRSQ